MASRMTVKGQVTIPKQVRQALRLKAGDTVDFAVNAAGEVVIRKAGPRAGGRATGKATRKPSRFEAALGTATIKWRTDELMALLRGTD